MNSPLLITYEYPPDHGGIAKYLKSEVSLKVGNVVVMRAQEHMMSLWPQWLPLIWKGIGALRDNKCKSMWVSHVLPVGYIALVYKKLFKIPYRVYVHGLDLARPRKSFWKRFWVRRILLNADEVVANSKASSKLLIYYSISPSIARVQYPRISSTDVHNHGILGKELRKKYGIGDKPVLLTVSRLVKRKGIDLVTRAMPEIWKKIPDLVYVIVGAGDERAHLQNLSNKATEESKSTQGGVLFTGSVSDEEKYGWLSACDCFILTPINSPNDFEGYGIVYKEAQMFSKPVIGSRVGGVPEAVGSKGVLVEAGNIDEIIKQVIQNIK